MALSNGDIDDDFECPLTTPDHPIFCILHRHSFVTGEPRDFKFGRPMKIFITPERISGSEKKIKTSGK